MPNFLARAWELLAHIPGLSGFIVGERTMVLEEEESSSEGALVVEAQEPSTEAPIADDAMRGILSTSEGRMQLAQAMTNPLRRRLDYQGVARRPLSVEPALREISQWPKHFVMGSWVRHVKYGYYAQVVDAVNKEVVCLDIWDEHNFSELPDDIFLDSEGYISVYIGTIDQWTGVEEPVLSPSIWEILDEDD